MHAPPPIPQNKGCAIAVASANGNTAKLHKVLHNVDGGTFTSDFFRSQAFQVSQLHSGARKSCPFLGRDPMRPHGAPWDCKTHYCFFYFYYFYWQKAPVSYLAPKPFAPQHGCKDKINLCRR